MNHWFMKTALAVILAIGATCAFLIWDNTAEEEAVKCELELLAGTWEVVSLVCAGEEIQAPSVGWNRMIVDRDGSYKEEEHRKYSTAGLLNLHPRRGRKAFEMIILEGGLPEGRKE